MLTVTKEKQMEITYETNKDEQNYNAQYQQRYRGTSIFTHPWWETIKIFWKAILKMNHLLLYIFDPEFHLFIKRKWLEMFTKTWLQDINRIARDSKRQRERKQTKTPKG